MSLVDHCPPGKRSFEICWASCPYRSEAAAEGSVAHQDVSTSASGSGQPRSAVATVSDVSLVLIGLALIVSAFSNIPAQVSGSLVSVGLAAPGALPVRATFGVVGFALLL